MEQSNVLGPIDIFENLNTARAISYDLHDDYQQEAKHEAERDEDQEIIDYMTSNSNETWDYLVTFMIDECGPAMYAAVKEASKKNPNHCEIGRLFSEAFNGCKDSYLSIHRED